MKYAEMMGCFFFLIYFRHNKRNAFIYIYVYSLYIFSSIYALNILLNLLSDKQTAEKENDNL